MRPCSYYFAQRTRVLGRLLVPGRGPLPASARIVAARGEKPPVLTLFPGDPAVEKLTAFFTENLGKTA